MQDKDISKAANQAGSAIGSETGSGEGRGGQPDGTMRNILGNFGWLISGKGFGAVCSIVYLAILARSLGLRDFGHFSLIFGTAQALVAIAGFQTWQAVVRFGAGPLHAGERSKFGRLALLCGVIDAGGALWGCLIAALIFYGFADALGLNTDFIHMAFAFNCALLWARTTAAVGVVRALDRFDISVYVEAIIPIGRLLAALGIWLVEASVGAFLLAWALIDLAAGAVYWIAAWRLAPEVFRRKHLRAFPHTIAEHPGLLRFVWITYLSSSLGAVFRQGPLLAVGFFLSTSAAGLYRLADQLAQGLGKLAALLGRAIYSEIARAHVAISAEHFRRLIVQITAMATLAGAIISLVAIFGGRHLLHLIGGESFAGGQAILVPLAIGSSLELAAIAYEPVLHTAGRAALSLLSRFSAIIAGVIAGAQLIEYGSEGIAWSVAIGSLASFLVVTSITWRVLSRAQEKR